MPSTITGEPPSRHSSRELRYGHEPHAAGFPARHVFTQETRGERNVLTPGDTSKDGILVIDDQGVSGASTPGEASDGPTLSH